MSDDNMISDEMLSAFLDAELPEADMARVRDALVEDEAIAERLAELAMVDTVVATAYSRIDQKPVPGSITGLFADTATSAPGQSRVIAFPTRFKGPLAIAASLLMAVGIGSQLLQSGDTPAQQLATVLEDQLSDSRHSVGDADVSLKLSFAAADGALCRQYDFSSASVSEQRIACKRNGEWQTVFNQPITAPAGTDYQTASANGALTSAIDSMMVGDFLTRQDEQALINQDWKQ